MRTRDSTELELYVETMTDDAVLVGIHDEVKDDELVWLPLSQLISGEPVEGEICKLTFLDWILFDKGLI